MAMSEIIFEATADKSGPQKLVETFDPLVSEVKMHFNDGGISVRAVDPANVGMIDATLAADAFESYDSPGAVTQGINLERLDERLGVGDSGDLANLSLDMETRKLNVDVGHISQAMGLIDPDSVRQEPDLPDLDLPNTVVLTGDQLETAVDAVGMVSNHVEITADDGDIVFAGQGDIDETTVRYGAGDCIDSDVTEDVASLFSHEFLEGFVDPMPADAEVELAFGDEFPVWFEWAAVEDCFDVSQMLAPRIQSN